MRLIPFNEIESSVFPLQLTSCPKCLTYYFKTQQGTQHHQNIFICSQKRKMLPQEYNYTSRLPLNVASKRLGTISGILALPFVLTFSSRKKASLEPFICLQKKILLKGNWVLFVFDGQMPASRTGRIQKGFSWSTEESYNIENSRFYFLEADF